MSVVERMVEWIGKGTHGRQYNSSNKASRRRCHLGNTVKGDRSDGEGQGPPSHNWAQWHKANKLISWM